MNLFELNTLRRIKQGDVKEFEKLFRKYYPVLCMFTRKYVNDMDSAEEIVQDLFYKLWKDRESIDVKTSLKAYLFQSVKNKALKVIDHNAVKQKHAAYVKQDLESTSVDNSDSIEVTELSEAITRTLNQLPERCREIFILSRFDGLKYHEIAEKLSISIKTVEANMGKALQLFRSSLKPFDNLAS
jgi:RNA polymerase sigma-70 factor (ECF subfamily)